MVGNTIDDILIDDLLMMPDAANTGDRERVLTDWTAASGTATWSGNRTDTTFSNETWFTIPAEMRYTLTEIQDAIDESLRETRVTVRTVIPTIDRERYYPLTNFSWIRNADDVDRVFYRPAENLLDNERFDVWTNGPGSASVSANPTSWTIAGSSGVVYRATTKAVRGPYAAQLLRSGTNVTLTQSIGLLNQQFADSAITIGVRMVGVSANSASLRIGINDGSGTTYGSYHSGGSGLEALTHSRTMASSSTACDIVISLEKNETVQIDHVHAVEAATVPQYLIDDGSGGQIERGINAPIINFGSVPTIVLGSPVSRKAQLVVVSRAPYPALTSDALESDCPELTLEKGTLAKLTAKRKPGQLRDRLDEIRDESKRDHANLARGLVDLPVEQPTPAAVVTGA